jgi:hypothetical protein
VRDRDRHFSSMLRSNSVTTHQLDNIPMMYLSCLARETRWNLNHVFVFDTIDLVRCQHDAIVIYNSFDVDSVVNQRIDERRS